jgi:hypothetical protein
MMRLRAIRLGVLAAVTGLFLGCGGDDGGDSDGTGGKAGSDASKCPSFKACGGDPTGDWTVDDVCASNEGKLFASTVNQPACASALQSVSNVKGSGEYKLGADKNAMSTIMVSGSAKFSFNDACAKALGIADKAGSECTSKIEAAFKKESAVKSATCMAAGANCDCTIDSTLSFAANASYTVNGNNLMVSGLTQPFCVEGGKFTVQAAQGGETVTFTLSK